MPSPLSFLTPILVAVSKLSSNSTATSVPQHATPPYLSHPLPMILPGIPQAVVPSYNAAPLNNSAVNTSTPNSLLLFNTVPVTVSNAQTTKAVVTEKALQAQDSSALTADVSNTQILFAPTPAAKPTTFEGKAAQLNNYISQYTQVRNTLFDAYSKFQNNSVAAKYNVRQICLSLLAASEYAIQCGNYFEEITTDNTLTQAQIDTLQTSFNAFAAQCAQDCIPYVTPRPQEIFFDSEPNTPANIADIVKVLHLLQYVINAYSKMIYSESGFYAPQLVIDYTGNGGTTIETGVIRFDVNMFQNFKQFAHMDAHEFGHLLTMIYDQESTVTVPGPLYSYAIPLSLIRQMPNQQNEAEADVHAAIVAALHGLRLSHPYTRFEAQPVLTQAQAAQNSHPQGVERARIMQESVSQLMRLFAVTPGKENIWNKFARNIRSISGINPEKDIPTMAELLRIYNLSPNNQAQQLETLKTSYPKLFTNTTHGDYPPAPVVTTDLDRQLASIANPAIELKKIRRGAPTQSIKEFQDRWAAAGGKLPFPTMPSVQPLQPVVGPRVAAQTVSPFPITNTAALPPRAVPNAAIARVTNTAVLPPRAIPNAAIARVTNTAVLPPRAIPNAAITRVYDAQPTNTRAFTPAFASASNSFASVPHATPAASRPAVIKEQEMTEHGNEPMPSLVGLDTSTRRMRA